VCFQNKQLLGTGNMNWPRAEWQLVSPAMRYMSETLHVGGSVK